ncbi:hypothetical protein HHL17_15880 [Chitinophaga sp. G-6-1-13]|uniref:DUF4198 domain-containing protein n=1 Tax=Chitinophaga fulva TaxID=2728842 RepID=A0A848GS94_9BACT|nr:hypothetical protein [Chitinophaga fulva]NML38688.1 hypothetical protein [Chitinophaga fulva]
MKKLLFSALLCCCMATAFGHALWIETIVNGKKGQAQEVKVFLGEYAENERDSTQNWFSNMRDFKLYLIDPSGKKQQLECTPAGNHFKATFTPQTDGAYVLYIDHTVQEVYSGSKIRYYAQGIVQVNHAKGLDNLKQNDFVLLTGGAAPKKINVPEKVSLLHKTKTTLPKAELVVQSPDGWTKKVKSTQDAFSYVPVWNGRYLLEGTFTEDEKGDHEGKPYERVWHCVTYCKDVTK